MKRIRVAFVASNDSTFIRRDREMLSESFVVRNVRWAGLHSIPSLVWAVLRSDATFSWFALDHAYGACRLARIFGRSSLVVVGGIDVARVPEIGYGAHLDPTMSRRSRYALAHSDRVLLVDESLRAEITRNTGIERPEIVAVPLGFDTEYYTPGGGPRTTVLTVGYVTEANLKRKGLETFVRTARLLPDLPFVLVGADDSAPSKRLRSEAPPNLSILPALKEEDLREQYRRARVYVQVSTYEGLPNALGEAMACGCVPVGTRVAGIPNLIGDTGPYVVPEDPEATARAVREAYGSDAGPRARERIQERFSWASRRAALRTMIEVLVG